MAKVILTGLNGYGSNFVRELLQDEDNRLIAVASGSPEKSPYYQVLTEQQVHFYGNIEDCLDKETPDMAIICTPMHIHYREVMACLEKGISVYCEKPLATTPDKTLAIKQLAKEKGVSVAVGFQWSYSAGIQALKRDILAGKYGRLKNMKTLADFVRPVSYFKESSWKGRKLDASGEVIFDNPASNAAAHFLHNMLFLAGPEMTRSLPVETDVTYRVECFKAHDIETFDTIFLEIRKGELQIGFYGTLVSDAPAPVEFMIECEKAQIVYPYDTEKHIAAVDADGTVTLYDCPDNDRFKHYQKAIKAMEAGAPQTCDVETVEAFQRVIEHIRLHAEVKTFDETDVVREGDNVCVKGISAKLKEAYGAVFSDKEKSY